MIPNIGPMEIAIVAIIALIVFGPKRLPELGRSAGAGMREFRDSVTGKEEKVADPGTGESSQIAVASDGLSAAAGHDRHGDEAAAEEVDNRR